MKQIKNVADVLVSTIDKKSYSDQLPVRLVNYTDVYYGDVLSAVDARMTATATRDQISVFRLREGDSVVTKDSETADDIGVSAYVAESADDIVCGYHLAIIRPIGGGFPKFLYWCLKSETTRGQFSNSANGMTRYGLTTGAIKSTAVPNPAPEEQRRIADFLDDQVARIDNIIAARRAQTDATNEAASSKFSAAIDADFDRYGPIPVRRWITSIEQGWSPVCSNVPAAEGEPGVLKLSSIRNGSFVAEQNKAMLPEDVPDSQYLVSAGQFLMSRANTPQLVGDCAVVTPHVGSLYLPDLLYRVNLLIGEPDYVSVALRSNRVRGLLAVIGRGTSMSMAKIRGDDIRELPVPASPMNVRLRRTVEFLELEQRRQKEDSRIAQSIDLFEEMKRSLITAAVTGEFDVSTADGSQVPV